jgi:hypothetical protein
MIGIYVLRPGYALDDLQWGTDRESFLKPLQELLDKHLFKYDSKKDIILDMEQIVKHPPINPNQVTAAIKIINSLPKTPLLQDLKLLTESLSKSFLKPLTESLVKRYAYTETETEAVSEPVIEVKRTANAPFFELPTKEQINEAADPMILTQIEKICEQLYQEKIFPEVNAFKNKMLKDKKNHRSILHTLCRAYMKRTFDNEGPWGYCLNTIKNESQSYNARDYQKAT